MARWKEKYTGAQKIAKDQAGKPEGIVATIKARRIACRHPEVLKPNKTSRKATSVNQYTPTPTERAVTRMDRDMYRITGRLQQDMDKAIHRQDKDIMSALGRFLRRKGR